MLIPKDVTDEQLATGILIGGLIIFGVGLYIGHVSGVDRGKKIVDRGVRMELDKLIAKSSMANKPIYVTLNRNDGAKLHCAFSTQPMETLTSNGIVYALR